MVVSPCRSGPVVGSRIGGIPDFVDHGNNGFLFEAGSAAQLAECLAAFVGDRELLGRMQQAIEPPRGLAAFVGDVLEVYEGLGSARRVAGYKLVAASSTATPEASTVAASPAAPLSKASNR